jgi:hypothetical protein
MTRGWRLSRIALGAAAALALCGFTAAGASAKNLLHLQTGGTDLAPGAPITASGTSFTLVTGGGTVSCSNDVLSGPLQTNGSATDGIGIEEASFTGEGEFGTCSSTYPPPLDEALVRAELLPWQLNLNGKGAAQVKSQVQVKVKPLNPPEPHGAVSCVYISKKMKTTFATNGEPITLNFKGIKFSLVANSGPECSRKGRPLLTASFALTSEGEPVTATIQQ